MIQTVYFAWVREGIGSDGETLALATPCTIAALLDRIETLSDAHAATLANRARLRFARNGAIVGADAMIAEGDEVAIFPPVTGG